MLQVKVDGKEHFAGTCEVKNMGELIELVKASIDPDTIITAIEIDGMPINDSDWSAPAALLKNKMIEIATGSKEQYVVERFHVAEELLDSIIGTFTSSKESYELGVTTQGSELLARAVNDLQAFIEWYMTLISMSAAKEVSKNDFLKRMTEIQSTCELLLQQQLYNSWWAVGETLGQKLVPQLGDLKSFCGDMVRN